MAYVGTSGLELALSKLCSLSRPLGEYFIPLPEHPCGAITITLPVSGQG